MKDNVKELGEHWGWVGDSVTQVVINSSGVSGPVHEAGFGGGNTAWNNEWAYIAVAEGSSEAAPDTVFMTARAGNAGLLRGVVGPDPAATAWGQILWYEAGGIQPMNRWFDNNIPSPWGAAGIFEPMILDGDADFILFHDNGKLHLTEDGGATWSRVDGVAYGDNKRYRSNGYDETCVNSIAVGSEGELYYSAGDIGLTISKDPTWQWTESANPGGGTLAPCSGASPPVDFGGVNLQDTETGDCIVVEDFNGSGSDALFLIGNDVIQRTHYNKLLARYEIDGAPTWVHATADVPNLDRYMMLQNTLVAEDSGRSVWFLYDYYPSSLCADPNPIVESKGFMNVNYDPVTEEWDTTIYPGDSVWPRYATPTSAVKVGSRLFASFGHSSADTPDDGGILYADPPYASWSVAFGFGEAGGYGDPRYMATDGEIIYFAARGGAGHRGGLYVIDAPLTAPDTWERLCNADEFDNVVPDVTPAGPIVSGRRPSYTDAYQFADFMFSPGAILIDPNDSDKVYFTLKGNENRLASFGGMWHYDRNVDVFTHLYPDDSSSGVGADRGRIVYTEAFSPPRVVYGTHCAGPRWFNYPGAVPIEPAGLLFTAAEIDSVTWDDGPVAPSDSGFVGTRLSSTENQWNPNARQFGSVYECEDAGTVEYAYLRHGSANQDMSVNNVAVWDEAGNLLAYSTSCDHVDVTSTLARYTLNTRLDLELGTNYRIGILNTDDDANVYYTQTTAFLGVAVDYQDMTDTGTCDTPVAFSADGQRHHSKGIAMWLSMDENEDGS